MTEAGAIKGAGGVVFNALGQVLVLGHRNGDWVFPKGHLEAGESTLEAALREVREEAGVEAFCPEPDIGYTTSYTNNRGEPRLISWFLLRTLSTKLDLREKTFPQGGFFSPEEAHSRLTFAEDRKLLDYMKEHVQLKVDL